MTHNMKLHADPFYKILNGIKTVELRLYDEKRRLINVGDKIIFALMDSPATSITVTVAALHRFDSFYDLYQKIPLEKLGYTDKEVIGASYTDMENYYSNEEQRKFGVVGIEITLPIT